VDYYAFSVVPKPKASSLNKADVWGILNSILGSLHSVRQQFQNYTF